MGVVLLNLRVDRDVSITSSTNGVETGEKILSKNGVQADFLLTPSDSYSPTGYMRVSVSMDPKNLPDAPISEVQKWIVSQLLDALGEKETSDG